MIAYLEGEPGGQVVANLFGSPGSNCFAHVVNMCEVYYHGIRLRGVTAARSGIKSLYRDGLIERRDSNRRFWHRVGEHKAQGRISLPDCFFISLAQEIGGEVLTSDHAEFDPLVPLGIVPIKFIR